jgi:hypothetical protein
LANRIIEQHWFSGKADYSTALHPKGVECEVVGMKCICRRLDRFCAAVIDETVGMKWSTTAGMISEWHAFSMGCGYPQEITTLCICAPSIQKSS